MKKSEIIVIIVACVILFVGLLCAFIAMLRIGFDFRQFSTTNTNIEAKTATYTPEKVNDVELKLAPTDRLTVRKSDDGEAHFSYYTSDEFAYTLSLPDENGDGDISLLCNDNRSWWEYISFGFNFSNEIVVELPDEYIGNLTIKTDTGKISLSELEINGDLTINNDTGKISLSELEINGDLCIESSTGDITCSDITAIDFSVSCSTADTELRHITCTSLNTKSSTGKTEISDITVSGSAVVKTSTGNIRLSEVSAQSFDLEASTGSIKGSIVGKDSDFTFRTRTSTGSNNLPESFGNGSIPLNVRTSTGNINITFTD